MWSVSTCRMAIGRPIQKRSKTSGGPAKKTGRTTAILLDTRGPEIRVGELGTGTFLNSGDTIVLSSGEEKPDTIPVNYDKFGQDVSAGSVILLDDGKMKLQVTHTDGTLVTAQVLVGGMLNSRKRVSLPDIEVNLPSLSEKDRDDIIFGVAQEVDFFAASFVRKAEDVENVRQVIRECGGNQAIIAKIENRQGVNNLTEILESRRWAYGSSRRPRSGNAC